ncbi:cAMP-dependent protein kinase regulatory subunit [Gregarina niphandrodes]|uniref:cAMP-dependent protein kinase regulatory subunit n=1 Tax=Gregarina niphandrodes TaxID=110365 RepID=A0A023B425_GRENI|nr:cAMP-dependent protein kinase regulatory subunit [Gregarina niphandrodes]EZG56140.1 cAMP-dependent protein kinase regulatory subunit [Gregarina niphandrodes]|eukprot:XP_011131313.1 cAMP-dependent protein kinase regulatory subunit [Gregarina niphandrodes]
MRLRRQGVSAAPVITSASPESWKPPEYYKTDRERTAILEAVAKHNVLFGHLSGANLAKVIGAMFRVSYKEGDVIIQQGDPDASHFYVIQSGQVGYYVTRGKSLPQFVGQAGPKNGFGELALLYGSPRAATVKALEDTELWALDRETFQLMLTTSENTKKRTYEEFLENVNVFKGLNRFEIVNLCDMLVLESYRPGQCIVSQGDHGQKFYILEKGEACAVVRDEAGKDLLVQHYTRGGYFGELALIGDGFRRASIYAISKCKLLSIDKSTFDR